MAKTTQKITLITSSDIPFKAGISVEALAEDIARRSLLQSINVRSVLDAHGAKTGIFEIPAGGRRSRALEILVMQKRLAKTVSLPNTQSALA